MLWYSGVILVSVMVEKMFLRHVTRVSEGNTLSVLYWKSSIGRKLTSSVVSLQRWCGVLKCPWWGCCSTKEQQIILSQLFRTSVCCDIYFVSTHKLCVCVCNNTFEEVRVIRAGLVCRTFEPLQSFLGENAKMAWITDMRDWTRELNTQILENAHHI